MKQQEKEKFYGKKKQQTFDKNWKVQYIFHLSEKEKKQKVPTINFNIERVVWRRLSYSPLFYPP